MYGIKLLDETKELVVTKGAKEFLENSIENLPRFLRNEVFAILPLLKNIHTQETSEAQGYSNASLALALRRFFESRKRKMSPEAFELFDAWCIALDTMIHRNRTRNTKWIQMVDEAIASTPKYPNRCVHVR